MTLLLVSVPVYASASSDVNDTNIGQLIVGDYENPVSLESIENARAEVNNEAESFVKETDSSIPKLALTLPEVEEGKIIAYAFVLTPKGIPIQYVGFAGSAASVNDSILLANSWYENCLTMKFSSEYSAKGAYWGSPIGMNTYTYNGSPYGLVTNSFEVYYLHDDANSTYDWYAVKQYHTIEPGCHAWGTAWSNAEAKPSHDWGWGDIEYSLFSHFPSNIINGQTTVGVSLSGGTGGAQASLEYDYTQPDIVTYDDTYLALKKAAWISSFSGTASLFSCEIQPGSVCQTYQQSSGSYNLVKIEACGIFGNSGNYMAVVHSWPCSIIY